MARKFITKKSIFVSASVILLSALIVGCGSEEPDAASFDPAETTEAGSPDAPPEAAPAEPEAASPEASAPQTVTDSSAQGDIQGRTVLCSTPSQTAQITWEGDEPRITLTEKPNQPVLNQASPVAIKEEADAVTYGYLQDAFAYLKTFDNGNCMVQTLDAQGNVIVEEYGRTS